MPVVDMVSTNLPLQLTSFIGREREIAEIKRLLSTTRLLTLTGAGGAGKTRLALQVAEELIEQYAEGVWFVDLAPLSDPALIPQAIAAVFDLHESADSPVISILTNYLKAKNLLLVLDNCEHLIAACAQLSDTLLRACPGLGILATSREGLNLAGETTFRVPSLSVPDPQHVSAADALTHFESDQLFIAHAAAADTHFQLTNENAPALAQICCRLDGMPLAIELAAARVKMLPVQQIAARLDDSLGLLTGGSRTALPRQQTLRATLDWSYALLSEQEQILFRRLAVFAGGWTLEAAEQVCGDRDRPSTILDRMSDLIAKSLVIVEEQNGQARYRLLEPIRQYSQEKLEESEEVETVHRLAANYFLALAEEAEPKLEQAGPTIWFRQLEVENDNLRTALNWSLTSGEIEMGLRLANALRWFWIVRGQVSEGREWLERLVAESSNAFSKTIRARAAYSIGGLAFFQGDYAVARSSFQECVALYHELGDRRHEASSLRYLGGSFQEMDRESTGRQLVEKALAMSREVGDERDIAACLLVLGEMARGRVEYSLSVSLQEETLAIYRKIGDATMVVYPLHNLGHLALYDSDYARAETYFKECLTLSQDLRDKGHMTLCLAGFAGLEGARGRPERAARLFGASEIQREMIGAPMQDTDRSDFDRNVAKAREQIDEATFNAAWAEGRAMTLEQAIAEAEQITIAQPESTAPATYPAGLTEREVEVLRLLALGVSNQKIADKLVLSKRTVEAHLRSIFGKLDVTTRSAATRAAIENKIV